MITWADWGKIVFYVACFVIGYILIGMFWNDQMKK